jgi:hypothetical protein
LGDTTKLEDLKPNAAVCGLLPDCLVTVVGVHWFGSEALYILCERKKRATEARACNGLVQSWPEIARFAREGGEPRAEQGGLFGETDE